MADNNNEEKTNRNLEQTESQEHKNSDSKNGDNLESSETEPKDVVGDADADADADKETDRLKFLQWVQNRFSNLDIDDDDDDGEVPGGVSRPETNHLLKGDRTLQGVANYIKSGDCKNICFMTGAGISTAAGIPDFRSPGSGLYDTMAKKFNLTKPQSLFEIDYYLANPEPFLYLAKELLNARVKPTVSHYFQRLVDSKGLLLRSFTQNIDALEHLAEIPEDKVVEAHGSTRGAHCLSCKKEYSQSWFKELVLADHSPTCEDCNALVKPDIIFFGENLPRRFFTRTVADLPTCDLLIIMGTSLVVQPFASMIDQVGKDCPRLLINREKAGTVDPVLAFLGIGGLQFDHLGNYRDVFWGGSCDDGCMALASMLGWDQELKDLVADGHAKMESPVE